MNPFDLLRLNPADLWKALTGGLVHPIDAKRWSVSIDDEPLGAVVTKHSVGADDIGGWAKWEYEFDDDNDPASPKVKGEVQSWVTTNKKHIIKVNGQDVEKDSVRVRVTTVGIIPKVIVIILHRFVDSSGEAKLIRFDGRL